MLNKLGHRWNFTGNPLNKFVAGFIGSPSMNFVTGQINDGVITARALPGHSLTAPASVSAEITIGLRPENLELDRDGTGLHVQIG